MVDARGGVVDGCKKPCCGREINVCDGMGGCLLCGMREKASGNERTRADPLFPHPRCAMSAPTESKSD